MYYIYILRCEDNSLYTGITTDVVRRFAEHREGGDKGAKYTRSHKPVNVVAVWETENKSFASRIEWKVKKLSKHDKEKLIENNENIYFEDDETSIVAYRIN